MDISQIREALTATMDLAGLDEATIALVAEKCRVLEYAPGDVITADDQPSTALYVVASGLVAVSSRGETRRAPVESVLGAGGLFGEDMFAGTGMMGAIAYRSSVVLRVEGDDLRAIAARSPALARVQERLAYIQHNAPHIVEALRRSPLLAQVPPAGIYPLLEGAELVRKGPREPVYASDDRVAGMVLVVEGAVRLWPETPGGPPAPRSVRLAAGGTFGEEGLLTDEPLMLRVVSGRDGCTLLRLRSETFRRQHTLSTSFRRAVDASGILQDADERVVTAAAAPDLDVLRHNWVALVGDAPGLPLPTFTEWLAEAAATECEDTVLVVHLDARAPVPPDLSELRGDRRVRRVRLRPDHVPDDEALVRAAIGANLVFLDFGEVDPRAHLPLLRRVNRTIYVATDPYRRVARPLLDELNRPLLYTAVVPTRRPEPGEVRDVPRGTVRIHRDLVEAARARTPYRALPEGLREQVGRWMRGVTERRVGLAFGGGGALAFAHMAVVQKVVEAGLPIDLVAGVSGGAVVGSFFAVGQERDWGPVQGDLARWPGLARFVERGGRFEWVCHPGIVSGTVIADWLDGELGGALLEDLLLPFFPVATDIDRAVQVSIRTGPVGFGVRASGSLPGPFTPTTFSKKEAENLKALPWRRGRAVPSAEHAGRDRIRYVDGGVLNNVPDDTLYLEGAQIVLASNVVPAPQERPPPGVPFPEDRGRFARFWREFAPFPRIDDAMRAGYMMMHSPADWRSRAADARFQARTTGFNFLDWEKGDAIRRQALEGAAGEHLAEAVAQLKRRYEATKAPAAPRSAPAVEAMVQAAFRSLRTNW